MSQTNLQIALVGIALTPPLFQAASLKCALALLPVIKGQLSTMHLILSLTPTIHLGRPRLHVAKIIQFLL